MIYQVVRVLIKSSNITKIHALNGGVYDRGNKFNSVND